MLLVPTRIYYLSLPEEVNVSDLRRRDVDLAAVIHHLVESGVRLIALVPEAEADQAKVGRRR